MIPELLKIGPITINSFGVMAMLAFLIPTMLMRKEFARKEMDPELANGIAIAAMIGGFLGARIYYILERWDQFLANPTDYIFTGAGLVWYGGFIGGFISVIWYVKRKKISPVLASDLYAPMLALGQFFGRAGCFLSADGDYGPPTDVPWAMSFPNGIVPTNELVHPTPIYDMFFLGISFFILWRNREKQFAPGFQFGLYLILVGIGRIITEFYRTTSVVGLGLTMAQWISIVLITIGTIIIIRGRRGQTTGTTSGE